MYIIYIKIREFEKGICGFGGMSCINICICVKKACMCVYIYDFLIYDVDGEKVY